MNELYIPIIIFTIIILGYMTYQDFKYREINIISLIALALFSVLYLWLFIFKSDVVLWNRYLLQLVISFVFILIFFILGKFSKFVYIGEGDLYTILAISFTNIFSVLFIMFLFLLSLLVTLLIPLSIFVYNLSMRHKPNYGFFNSLFLMFLGYPLKLKSITNFYTPLERFEESRNNKYLKVINFRPNTDPAKELSKIKRIANLEKVEKLWVSPLIPFVISILISYIILIIILINDGLLVVSNFLINIL